MKTPNKRELQEIAISHSSNINFKDFMKMYNKRIAKQYFFLVNDAALPSDDSLPYIKNL